MDDIERDNVNPNNATLQIKFPLIKLTPRNVRLSAIRVN